MSFQGLLAVITKTSKEFFRQRWSIPFIIGFPVFFFLMFGIAFGGTAGGTNSIAIGVFDTDNGILGYFSFSEQYNDLLDSIKYPNSTVKVFQVSFFDNELALRRAVQSGVVGIGLVIPEDFSYTILSAINQSRFFASGEFSRRSDLNISESSIPPLALNTFRAEYNSTLAYVGDPNAPNFQIAKNVLDIIMNEYVKGLVIPLFLGMATISIESMSIDDPVENQSVFTSLAPGLFAFAVILQISVIGALLSSEYERKTIHRIVISPLGPLTFLGGVFIFQLIQITIQYPIMIVFAEFFGFKPNGDYFLGLLIMYLLLFSVSGFSFIIAGLVKTSDTAGTLGGLFSAPLAFLTGGFGFTPPIVLAPSIFPAPGGILRDLLLSDVFPITHATTALKGVLLYQYSLNDILFDIAASIALAIPFLLLGTFLFVRYRYHGAI